MATAVNDLLKRLMEAKRGGPDVVPAGHKSASQLQAEWKKGRNTVKALIDAGLKEGILGVKRYRVLTNGLIRVVPHYFEVKKSRAK